MKIDIYEYIRNYYGVPIFKGAKVSYKDRSGVVTGVSGPHVKARLDGDKNSGIYHPRDLTWQSE